MSTDSEQHRLIAVLHAIAERETALLHDGTQPWSRWLTTAARHGRFGFTNTMLIRAQRPDATDVRSYQQWQERSRQVSRGESGIRIFSRRGLPRAVFDIAQTEGPTSPSAPATTSPDVWERLHGLAASLGIQVDHGEHWTYTGPPGRLLRVPMNLDGTPAIQYLAHQLAHILRPGDRPHNEEPPDNNTSKSPGACSGTRHIIAESIAWLVLTELGLDLPPPSLPPVASWSGIDPRAQPVRAITAVGEIILRTSLQAHRRLATLPPATISPTATSSPIAGSSEISESPSPAAMRPPAASKAADEPPPPPVPLPADLLDVLNSAQQIFLQESRDSWVPGYLARRSLGGATEPPWKAGYAPPGADRLIGRLRALGHTDQSILNAGLARIAGGETLRAVFRDRLMLAIRDPEGVIRGFIGRRADTATGPKYLNSPNTELFNKGELLYGLHEICSALASGARLVLTEGPFDAIAINVAVPRTHAAIALCGTAITSERLDLLIDHADLTTSGMLLALDGDRAGRAAALRSWPLLSQISGPVAAVTFPAGHDPTDILKDQGVTGIRTALQRELPLASLAIDAAIEAQGQSLSHPEGQLAAARAAAKVVVTGRPNDAARHAAHIAARLNLPPGVVNEVLIDAVTNQSSRTTNARQLADQDFPLPNCGTFTQASSTPTAPPAHPQHAATTTRRRT